MNSQKSALDTQKSPDQQEINTLCAMYAQGQYAEAETLAQAMTARFPQFGFGWTALGAVLKQMGRGVDALAAMRKAEALTPNDAEVHYNLGLTLHDLGRLDEATASYRSALQIKPDYAEAHYKLGNTLYALGRPDEAEASYRNALLIKPDYAEAHYNMASAVNPIARLNGAKHW